MHVLSADPMPKPSAAMEQQGIGIRPAASQDMDWLRDLYCASRAEELAPLDWTSDFKRLFLANQFRLQHDHYVRAHPDSDRLIVTSRAASGIDIDIGRLYLDRTLRPWRLIEITLEAGSRNRGIGGILMQWLKAAAGASSMTAIDLHVASDNQRAQRFYERLGFQQSASLSETHLRMTLDCRTQAR